MLVRPSTARSLEQQPSKEPTAMGATMTQPTTHTTRCLYRAARAVTEDARDNGVDLTPAETLEEATTWLALDVVECRCAR